MAGVDFNRLERDLSDELFADDGAFDDPDVARQTAQARELNVILHDTAITFGEALHLQESLDQGVLGWIDERVDVSGTLIPDMTSRMVHDRNLTPKIVAEEAIKFVGFYVKGEFDDDDEDATVVDAEVMYAFRVPAKLLTILCRGS